MYDLRYYFLYYLKINRFLLIIRAFLVALSIMEGNWYIDLLFSMLCHIILTQDELIYSNEK